MSETTTQDPLTVLCVDDEPNILKSIRRLLHKEPLTLLVAESGEQALELLSENEVHLVISDMKMPSMSGAQLLEHVATTYPDVYRILLTGYADMESTIAAVNKGKIHRYLEKPWDNEEVVSAIHEGLQTVELKRENTQFKQLIKKQNDVLKELNHNLEDKIKLRTKQINVALQRINRHNTATQQVLFNFVSINPNLHGSFASNVSQLAKRLCQKLELEKQQIDEISYAALLCEIGLLGLSPSVQTTPFGQLNIAEQREYLEQTNIAQLILGPAEHLQSVSDIITCQFEHVNGNGLNKLTAEQIPTGSKVLAIARDYWRFVSGRILPEELDDSAALAEMKKSQGTKYDTDILQLLLDNPDLLADECQETRLSTAELKPGMVLKYNILSKAHILVLAEGHVFSEKTIQKLINYETSQEEQFSLVIDDTEDSA